MEDLLLQLVKDASGAKFSEIRSVCQELHDLLEAQQGSVRAAPHELRQKCISALQLALLSHNTKLITHSLTGFQKLIRDDRFQSTLECELEEQWLPSQLLMAIGSIKSFSDDVQIELLKVLLNMACTTWWSMNEVIILRILNICQEAYCTSNAAVKIAAQATASQTLWAFCDHLQKEEKVLKKNPFLHAQQSNVEERDTAFSSLVPILQYFCRKLQKKPRANNLKERVIPFYLESLLSLVTVLPENVLKSSLLQDYLWKEFCPTLLSLLGSPKMDKMAVSYSQKVNFPDNQPESTWHSNTFASSPSLITSECRTVYNIAAELVRLAGPFRSLRPMLESVFHRNLLSTSPSHRLDALRATKEILKKPDRLLKFAGPPLIEDKNDPCCTDLGLLKLAMDAFVECSHCSDKAVCYQSVDCVVSLLDSLEKICDGVGLTPEYVVRINDLYHTLENADYCGPMTYQSWEKLKKLAEEQQTFMLYQAESGSDKNGNDELATKDDHQTCNDNNDVVDVCDRDAEQPSVLGGVETQAEDGLNSNELKNDDIALVDACTLSSKESDMIYSGNQDDDQSGYETDSSGATEGPEEGFDEVDDDVEEAIDAFHEDQALKRQRIPKSLLNNQNGEAEQERVAKLYETRELYAQQERCNAHHFTDVLSDLLPKLLSIKSSIETDEALQEFASNYCEEVHSGQKGNAENVNVLYPMIVNADGVYLATYTALLLNLKLIHANYYDGLSRSPPLTEEQFIDSVHGSGVLVYLSSSWLAELYQQVLTRNFLGDAGYDRTSHDNCALINLLTDIEGLKNGHKGAHLLSDYFRLERAGTSTEQVPDIEAGRKFSRRVLTGCWSGILEVLSVLLNGKNAVGVSSSLGLMLGTEGAKEEHKRARDAIANSLEGLQKAARLSNILSIHSRCETIFALLASVSCPETETCATPKKLKTSILMGKNRPLRLHASHVLSMDVILSRGLELGSHNPDCWKHVFRCCLYLAELENSFFSTGLQLANASQTIPPVMDSDKKKMSADSHSGDCFPLPPVILHSPLSSVNIPDFVKENVVNLGSGGTLSPDKTLQLLCILSQHADRLFDDAAYKLNLKALLGFLNALCAVSQKCLFSLPAKRITKPIKNKSVSQTNLSLLHRVGGVMLKCIRSGRPLIHVMQVWSIIGLHLMEAACHHDQDVAKTAVTSIHDIVNALLGNQSELPYFHFNEALFKPFENLLCLELCDSDIQDQIISSICEFVEGCTVEIRSGWRPLFGALRAVRPTSKEPVQENDSEETHLNSNHIRAALDVFEAFLKTENVLVFANAAVDCILCLLKHIKGEPQDGDFQKSPPACRSQIQPNLCLASLKYLHKCCSILASMQQMPSCPIFHSSSRIKLGSCLQFIDPDIPGMTFVYFTCDGVVNESDSNKKFNMEKLDVDVKNEITLESFQENLLTLEKMELPSGILHVWCLVLEGLVGAIVGSSQNHHSFTIETLFDLLQKIYEIPGAEFGLYIINHLLLPMIQMWLRRTARIYRGWDNFASHFKQCCGLTSDLIVDYITKLTESNLFDTLPSAKLMVYQLLQLLTECVAQPTESISRLGCSCIRHIIVTAGPQLKTDMWELICQTLRCACKASLFSLKQLMVAFHAGSDNFYGDVGQVKVAAKSDCSPEENERLKQLAQQVFLLDNQRVTSNDLDYDDPIDDDRSYIFLLYPPDAEQSNNPEVLVVKVPFRNLVVGLLSHQILLQIIGSVLLQGVPRVVPSLANILLQSPAPTSSVTTCTLQSLSHSAMPINDNKGLPHTDLLPGMMKHLSKTQLLVLLSCLEDSYKAACAFDARPGLKFLVQKVAHAKAAANLYKQSGASWTMHSVVLLELCLHYPLCEGKINKKGEENEHKAEEVYFVSNLKNSFTDMCTIYAELFIKKDDDCFDRLRDQPIFFLVAQTDDYMEMRHKNDNKPTPLTVLQSPKEEERNTDLEEPTTETLATGSPDDSPESAHDVLADLSSVAEETWSNEKENTQVYNVASQKDIDSVVSEFKRRKQQHAMPSTKREKKRYPLLSRPNCNHSRSECQETKLPSILKDHEAHIKVRTEMILSIFDFFCQLDDDQFKVLLPTVFPFVRTLVVHGKDEMVRQNLAEFLDRIAILFSFQAE